MHYLVQLLKGDVRHVHVVQVYDKNVLLRMVRDHSVPLYHIHQTVYWIQELLVLEVDQIGTDIHYWTVFPVIAKCVDEPFLKPRDGIRSKFIKALVLMQLVNISEPLQAFIFVLLAGNEVFKDDRVSELVVELLCSQLLPDFCHLLFL